MPGHWRELKCADLGARLNQGTPQAPDHRKAQQAGMARCGVHPEFGHEDTPGGQQAAKAHHCRRALKSPGAAPQDNANCPPHRHRQHAAGH